MSFKTPTAITVGVVSALAGVAAAAIALPSSPPATTTTATATPEVRTETVRRTIHVTRRDRSGDDNSASRTRGAAPAAATTSTHRSRGFDDSGHHRGDDDSGHHGGDDDDGGQGRRRGRGGDDD
jgi:hypothetical protein